MSRASLAREAARRAGLNESAVIGQSAELLGWPARRPAFSALDSVRGRLLPSWGDALDRYFCECEESPVPSAAVGR